MATWQSITAWVGQRLGLTDTAFWSAWGINDSYAGKTVTLDTALQISTVWSCIRLISETVSTFPLGLFTRDAKGNKASAGEHRLNAILKRQPNEDQTAVEFIEGLTAWLCAWGNFYAEIFRDQDGRILRLETLPPNGTAPIRTPDRNELKYEVTEGGRKRTLPRDRVFHVKGFGFGGDVGLSPIGVARQTLGSALAAEEATAKIFGSGLAAAGILQSDQTLKPDQRTALKNIMTEYMGSTNAGKIMILEAGLKFQQVSLNPEDAQLLATRAFQVEDMCRWFRVPPFMIGHTEKSTSWGTGLEQQMIGFLTFALLPYLRRIEASINQQLLLPKERDKYFAEFNFEGLLRADSAARASFYSTALQNGWMNRNEVRAKENLPAIDGGEVFTVQTNLTTVDQIGQGDAAEEQAVINFFRKKLLIEDKSDGQKPASESAIAA
jgi:HK97 family phage portal protein